MCLWFFEWHLWQNSNHGPFCSLLRRTAQNCRCVSQRWRTCFTFLLCYAGDVLGKPKDRILELCVFLSDLVSNSSASPRDGARENGIERAWQETGIVHSNEGTALSRSSGMFLLKGRAYGVVLKMTEVVWMNVVSHPPSVPSILLVSEKVDTFIFPVPCPFMFGCGILQGDSEARDASPKSAHIRNACTSWYPESSKKVITFC